MNEETEHFIRWFLNSTDPDIVKYRSGFNVDDPANSMFRLRFLISSLYLKLFGDDSADMPELGDWDADDDYIYWQTEIGSASLFAPMLDTVLNRIDFQAATLEVVKNIRQRRSTAYLLN